MVDKKKYWYKTTFYECPICGSGGKHRERQYSWPPPEKWARERYEYEVYYDYCDAY